MSDTEMWSLPNGAILVNVHSASMCDGTPCWIHTPSDHNMRDWPIVQQRAMGRMFAFRECLHGDLHHDPDDLWFMRHILHIDFPEEVEDCDGCCGYA